MRKDIKHNFKTNPMLMDETKKIRLKKLGVIIFGSVRFLSKKVTKPKFFYFKKTEIEPKPGQTDRFRFSLVFQGKNLFKPVWLCFSGLARFFFPAFFVSVSVRFEFFFAYKTETEPAGFFKILIGFFFCSVFAVILFFQFSRFNRFFGFFAHL